MCSLTNADLVVVNPRDVILKITSAAICGSDLHLLQWFDAHDGKGRRPVHEPMGELVAVGSADAKFNSNDSRGCSFRSYAACFFCHKGLFPTLRHIELKRGSRTKSDGSVSRRFVRLFAYVGRIRGE
jgi:threonine dehydrogenase-like Zn-dependent dehydrogenase